MIKCITVPRPMIHGQTIHDQKPEKVGLMKTILV